MCGASLELISLWLIFQIETLAHTQGVMGGHGGTAHTGIPGQREPARVSKYLGSGQVGIKLVIGKKQVKSKY